MSLNVGGSADADVEVRMEDQKSINEFGRLNNRVVEIRAEIKQAKEDSEKMDDAVVDLSMVVDGKVMVFMGETFFETSEEFATEYCESKMEVRSCHSVYSLSMAYMLCSYCDLFVYCYVIVYRSCKTWLMI